MTIGAELPPGMVQLSEIIDARGSLIVGEVGRQLPFKVRRFFVVSGVPQGEPRGIHAHKECHQFLVCVAGSVKAMVDDGKNRHVVELNSPSMGLHMAPLTWGCQYDYSADAVLLVLASHAYDATDYIHEYSEFEDAIAKRARELNG
jgi:UDP-2-acetamido-3-amino-2,3-dideoxy-glucuronate N-acetyltransferase